MYTLNVSYILTVILRVKPEIFRGKQLIRMTSDKMALKRFLLKNYQKTME
jgi:hypothetical protein